MPRSSAKKTPPGPRKILVIDDSADLREALVLLLGKEFAIVEARNGREGVAAFAKERPRLVLLDVAMPGMNGVETLAAIKELDPSATVLMLTATTNIEMARKALEHGAAAYVTKPFDMGFLRNEVRRLLRPHPDAEAPPWRAGD
ncbi:MAG: response regulator [Elusimicrobia bacterium]|nr:response regulator [Elusimicrobiota bacterium]